jgi:hypothetical protein
MTIKRMIVTAVAVLSIALLGTLQVGAYELYEFDPPENGYCSQCHTFPGANHDFHTNNDVSCNLCHVDGFSNPVPVNACESCHAAGDLFALHGGIETPSGEYCGYCHEGVGNENRNWTELRQLFE